MTNVKNQANPEHIVLKRRIGSTTYHVGIYFNGDASETLHEKVCRLLTNELQSSPKCAIISPLQAGRLSERSSA